MARNRQRTEAQEKGLKRYKTPDLCKWGHDSERFVSSGACVQCQTERKAAAAAKKAASKPKKTPTPRKPSAAVGEAQKKADKYDRESPNASHGAATEPEAPDSADISPASHIPDRLQGLKGDIEGPYTLVEFGTEEVLETVTLEIEGLEDAPPNRLHSQIQDFLREQEIPGRVVRVTNAEDGSTLWELIKLKRGTGRSRRRTYAIVAEREEAKLRESFGKDEQGRYSSL